MEFLHVRLQNCAEKKRVTQAEVAEACEIPRGSMSRYFTGASLPKSRELYSLAVYFGVSMEWLLVGDKARESTGLRVKEESVEYKTRMDDKIKALEEATQELLNQAEEMKSKFSE